LTASRVIAIERTEFDCRAALYQDGLPVEILHDTEYIDRGPRVGDVYWGRATAPAPDGSGVFVDIGEAGEAFLPTGRRDRPLRIGEAAAIVVTREREAEKVARVSNRIEIVSAFAVMSAQAGPVSVSTRIPSQSAQVKLAQIAGAESRGRAVTVRTAAFERPDALREALRRASGDLDTIAAAAGRVGAPRRIHAGRRSIDAALDRWAGKGNAVVSCNDRAEADVGRWLSRHGLDTDVTGDHPRRLVDEAFEAAVERRFAARTCRLTFEETEALTCVDVDAGANRRRACWAQSVLKDVFRLIRLRRIGGQIVVDLPARAVDHDAIEAARSEASNDPARPTIERIGNSGLLAIIRRSEGPSWLSIWTSRTNSAPVPGRRWSSSKRAADAAVEVERTLSTVRSRIVEVRCGEAVRRRFDEFEVTDRLASRYGRRFSLVTEPAYDPLEIKIIEG